MRFALMGDHPDGVEMACALAQSGRHRILAYTAALGEEILQRLGGEARRVSDPEEILADPAVEAVVIAGHPSVRPAQLRRALQSERHVLCVHPPDQTPEIAYEAAMIRNDTGCVLLPLLPEATHPAFRRLAEFVRRKDGDGSPIGTFRLFAMERGAAEEVLDGIWIAGQKPSFPGWDILRTVGGEIQEVSAFAEQEELREGEPVLVAGRFEQGGLFQLTLTPREKAPGWRLSLVGSGGRAELHFPLGWNGPAYLNRTDENGESHEESWERWDPWPVLVEMFEQMGAGAWSEDRAPAPDAIRGLEMDDLPTVPQNRPHLSWQDAIRGLELDDAARRSVERRRSSLLEYPEATEEVGFKGTMTLLGCGLVWAVLLMMILSVWWPKVGWLIVPLLVLFLALQFLRYLLPGRRGE
jgi:predicted dehydrogenase